MIMLGSCPDAMKPADLGDHSYFAYFVVDDVDGFYEEFRSRGVVFTFLSPALGRTAQ
jgi:hypothetical protein